MRIAIDYDGTFTKDSIFWLQFVKLAYQKNHEIFCITLRPSNEPIFVPFIKPNHIIYTNNVAKGRIAQEKNLNIDIWIDGSPNTILHDNK